MIPLAWLWVLGSLGLLIILFLVSSVHVSFSYDKKMSYRLRWLFISVSSDDGEKKPAEEKQKEKPQEKKKEKPKTSFLKNLYKGEGLTGIIDILREVSQTAQGALKNIFGHLIVKKFYIDICTACGDAAQTAILYGQVCAGVYPCAGIIVSNTKCRSYDINIYPDFNEKAESKISVDFKGRVKLFFILKTALSYGLKLLKIYKNRIIPSIVRGERINQRNRSLKKTENENGKNTVPEEKNSKEKE